MIKGGTFIERIDIARAPSKRAGIISHPSSFKKTDRRLLKGDEVSAINNIIDLLREDVKANGTACQRRK